MKAGIRPAGVVVAAAGLSCYNIEAAVSRSLDGGAGKREDEKGRV